jgi:Superfamily II DNA/RNA helicase required for DNA uptake (late competence protein)
MKRGSAIIPATYTDNDQKIRCRRCLMTIDTDQFADSKYYCRNCINLGKLTKSTQLVITPTNCKFLVQNNPLAWDGHLTDLQKSVSDELIVAYDNRQDHLIWAVTGAGKTEMTFPLIEKIILNNERVALCSPRVDVCLELYPRIKRAFPNTTIGLFTEKVKINIR